MGNSLTVVNINPDARSTNSNNLEIHCSNSNIMPEILESEIYIFPEPPFMCVVWEQNRWCETYYLLHLQQLDILASYNSVFLKVFPFTWFVAGYFSDTAHLL